jgi:hypothetical protein
LGVRVCWRKILREMELDDERRLRLELFGRPPYKTTKKNKMSASFREQSDQGS